MTMTMTKAYELEVKSLKLCMLLDLQLFLQTVSIASIITKISNAVWPFLPLCLQVLRNQKIPLICLAIVFLFLGPLERT